MPTYEYACKACGQHLEVVQSFKDGALTDCPACGGPLRKVFGNIGIAFKGSGFYRTDSRDSSTRPASKSSETKASDGTSPPSKSAETSSGTSSATSSSSSSSSTSSSSASAAAQ